MEPSDEKKEHVDANQPASDLSGIPIPPAPETAGKRSPISKAGAVAIIIGSLLIAAASGFSLPVLLAIFVLWILIVFILKATGHTNAAKNIGRAIGTVLLVIIILGVVGFGACLLILSASWH